jgi:hypothetical protein
MDCGKYAASAVVQNVKLHLFFLSCLRLNLDGRETQQANVWTPNAPYRNVKDSDLVQIII